MTGITAAIGSSEKRMIRKPIIAFQNPATIHGSVIAKQHEQHKVDDAEAARRQRQRGKRQGPGHGGGKQDAKQHTPAGHGIPGNGDLRWLQMEDALTRDYDF